ncbi:MAG: precorrin-6Y C5,15-methyltransferase (decarboxylating) subunit CbiT [Lachnospiraceae bacterium]|nr:precorrin-6Y C5,15-methyltransferase (decarboxylating) subunit CbiT [Lachnospiraceae bacterium]
MQDNEFIRGPVPMTKSEVRAVSLAKLALFMGAVFWDVGAGTGSISIEAARWFAMMKGEESCVYAIEKDEKAIALLKQNRERLVPEVEKFYIIEGRAPDVLKALPAPTHVLIGGSGGELEAVVDLVFAKNPKARIVINSITAETLFRCIQLCQSRSLASYEIIQMAVTRLEAVGPYHMHKAMNPVYIALLEGQG